MYIIALLNLYISLLAQLYTASGSVADAVVAAITTAVVVAVIVTIVVLAVIIFHRRNKRKK